jgi:hypothetical protein
MDTKHLGHDSPGNEAISCYLAGVAFAYLTRLAPYLLTVLKVPASVGTHWGSGQLPVIYLPALSHLPAVTYLPTYLATFAITHLHACSPACSTPSHTEGHPPAVLRRAGGAWAVPVPLQLCAAGACAQPTGPDGCGPEPCVRARLLCTESHSIGGTALSVPSILVLTVVVYPTKPHCLVCCGLKLCPSLNVFSAQPNLPGSFECRGEFKR